MKTIWSLHTSLVVSHLRYVHTVSTPAPISWSGVQVGNLNLQATTLAPGASSRSSLVSSSPIICSTPKMTTLLYLAVSWRHRSCRTKLVLARTPARQAAHLE